MEPSKTVKTADRVIDGVFRLDVPITPITLVLSERGSYPETQVGPLRRRFNADSTATAVTGSKKAPEYW